MGQFLGFGSGSDGALTISTNTTQAPIDASCSGTSGATALTATNASFAADQYVLIIQMRGTGVGAYEVNKISSYSAGTITLQLPLSNTYTDSVGGADQAQVVVLSQYTGVTIDAGVTLTAKAWDGDVGGVLAFLVNGTLTVNGTISGTGKGFRGGPNSGNAGEGTVGGFVSQKIANGNGGGASDDDRASGAGGGNGLAGSDGGALSGFSSDAGIGGSTSGTADLTTMTMGGGGGASFGASFGTGAAGGAIIFIMASVLTLGGSAAVVSNGNAGSAGTGAGGGGSGGSILVKTQTATAGTNLITATGGSGGSGSGNGGNGGTGRIAMEACQLTGTTNPSNGSTIGGKSWCGANLAIL